MSVVSIQARELLGRSSMLIMFLDDRDIFLLACAHATAPSPWLLDQERQWISAAAVLAALHDRMLVWW